MRPITGALLAARGIPLSVHRKAEPVESNETVFRLVLRMNSAGIPCRSRRKRRTALWTVVSRPRFEWRLVLRIVGSVHGATSHASPHSPRKFAPLHLRRTPAGLRRFRRCAACSRYAAGDEFRFRGVESDDELDQPSRSQRLAHCSLLRFGHRHALPARIWIAVELLMRSSRQLPDMRISGPIGPVPRCVRFAVASSRSQNAP